jgi:hypothetical protein
MPLISLVTKATACVSPGPLLGTGQNRHASFHGDPGGEPQTLGHPFEVTKSGPILSSCRLT